MATVLALLSIVSMTLVPLGASEDFTEDIKVLSSRGEVTSWGYYELVGEVQNTGSTTWCTIELLATFYDSNNTILGHSHSIRIELGALPPGAKSPFSDILLQDLTWIPKIDHYDFQVVLADDLNIFNISPGLQILSKRAYTDDKGLMHFEGEIKNTGTATADSTIVYITLYDSSGKVVDVMRTFDSYSINHSDTAIFSRLYAHKTRAPLAESYTLTAESNSGMLGYGLVLNQLTQSPIPIQPSATPSVPEFPVLTVILLFVIIPLITTIFLRKIKPTISRN